MSQHLNVQPVQVMMTFSKSFVQCGNVNIENKVQNGKLPELFISFSCMWRCFGGINEY